MIRDWRYSTDPNQGVQILPAGPFCNHRQYIGAFIALERAALGRVADLAPFVRSFSIEVDQETARRAALD